MSSTTASGFERLQDAHYGVYGGIYVSEPLIPPLQDLERAFLKLKEDKAFLAEYNRLLADYAGRPTPLYEAQNLSQHWGGHRGARIFLKREDLLHGGAHKTNNALGQALMAKAMGKTRLIAETGAGQHGVATAMAGALLGLPTEIYMGAVDIERQAPNVYRMKLLGATVHSVESGSKTLKDAINDALRDWVSNARSTYYVMGTVAGPYPYPALVKFFQKIIGEESKQQFQERLGKLPEYIIACVGGGSNAIGMFDAFLDDARAKKVQLIGVEPGGKGIETSEHGAVLSKGTLGCLHGMKSYCLQDEDGQIHETYSIAAGLDYPLVGPEHCQLRDEKIVRYESATDAEALEAFSDLAKYEGILPALESSHALAYAKKIAQQSKSSTILVNLSGRGDKDLHTVMQELKL